MMFSLTLNHCKFGELMISISSEKYSMMIIMVLLFSLAGLCIEVLGAGMI